MNLRNVIFSLKEIMDYGFDPDATEEEIMQKEERCRERKGQFHGWHETEEKSPYLDNYLVKRVALIEDLETGKIHEISHENFSFTKE